MNIFFQLQRFNIAKFTTTKICLNIGNKRGPVKMSWLYFENTSVEVQYEHCQYLICKVFWFANNSLMKHWYLTLRVQIWSIPYIQEPLCADVMTMKKWSIFDVTLCIGLGTFLGWFGGFGLVGKALWWFYFFLWDWFQ